VAEQISKTILVIHEIVNLILIICEFEIRIYTLLWCCLQSITFFH